MFTMTTYSMENLINLKTLQRVDSSIIEILDNACQVAIYKYERKLEKWEETDVEGTLFLYRRTLFPHHGFIIVNRMSTTNFVESITDDMQFKLQEPYLLYKNHSGDIIGSWFYEHKDLQRISEKILSILSASPLKRQRCASESESHAKSEENQHIMALLSEAHLQYIKKANDEGSQCKDANNLNTYLEKKSLEKSVPTAVKKQESEGPVYSFEENYPVSPRRRFMSTGSFDPDRTDCLSRMRSANQLSTRLKLNQLPSSKIPSDCLSRMRSVQLIKNGNVRKDSSNEDNSNNLNVKSNKSLDLSNDYSKTPTDCPPHIQSAHYELIKMGNVLKDSSNEDNSNNQNVMSSKSLDHSTDYSKTPTDSLSRMQSSQYQLIKMGNALKDSSNDSNLINLNVESSKSLDHSTDCSKTPADDLSHKRSAQHQLIKMGNVPAGSSNEVNSNNLNVKSSKSLNHSTDCSKASADHLSLMWSSNKLSAQLTKLGNISKDYSKENNTNQNVKSSKSSDHSTDYSKAPIIEENFNVSPHRQFQCTGSYEPDRTRYLSSMQSGNKLSVDLIKLGNVSRDSSNEDYTNHQNTKSNKSSRHSTDYIEASPVVEASNLNKFSEARFEILANENDMKNPKYPGHQNNTAEHSHIHFESIRSAIKVHIQDNPSMLVKVHEAYVSSLKSLFNLSSF